MKYCYIRLINVFCIPYTSTTINVARYSLLYITRFLWKQGSWTGLFQQVVWFLLQFFRAWGRFQFITWSHHPRPRYGQSPRGGGGSLHSGWRSQTRRSLRKYGLLIGTHFHIKTTDTVKFYLLTCHGVTFLCFYEFLLKFKDRHWHDLTNLSIKRVRIELDRNINHGLVAVNVKINTCSMLLNL